MDEIIDALNSLAVELLDGAHALDAQIDALEGGAADAEAIHRALARLCQGLGATVDQLERPASPLRRLVRMLGGIRVAVRLERLGQYLADHRAALVRLQVPDAVIDRVVDALRRQGEAGEHALDQPESLAIDDALAPLGELRALVCELAQLAQAAQLLIEPTMLRQVVRGVIGAATVVVDVTAAASAGPVDPVGWVLLKAVKSVWAGVSAVRGALGELRTGIATLRDTLGARTARARQDALRNAAKGRRRLRPKDDPDGDSGES